MTTSCWKEVRLTGRNRFEADPSNPTTLKHVWLLWNNVPISAKGGHDEAVQDLISSKSGVVRPSRQIFFSSSSNKTQTTAIYREGLRRHRKQHNNKMPFTNSRSVMTGRSRKYRHSYP